MPMSTEKGKLIGIFYLLDESKSVFGHQKDLCRKNIKMSIIVSLGILGIILYYACVLPT